MLTLFAVPKIFSGHFNTIQRNAIQSWMQLKPACQILLFGNDPGTAETARELGLHHVPDVQTNEHGTPLLSSVFQQAEALSEHDRLLFINADIILLGDSAEAVQSIPFRRFFLVGRRTRLDVTEPIDFSQDWETPLREAARKHGQLDNKSAIDYFLFQRGSLGEIPPFAIGRPVYDNWLIYNARARGIPVIDGTPRILAVHQNHDYSHAAGMYQNQKAIWEGVEARKNEELAGGRSRIFTIDHATWVLTSEGKIRPNLDVSSLSRRWSSLPVLPISKWRVKASRFLLSLAIGWQEKRLALKARRSLLRLNPIRLRPGKGL